MGTSDLPPQQQASPYPSMTPAGAAPPPGYPQQPAPYPPQQPGTVNAPGGYAAAPAPGPPGTYPSSSAAAAAAYPGQGQYDAPYPPGDKLTQQQQAAPYPAADAGSAGYAAPGAYPGAPQQPATAIGIPASSMGVEGAAATGPVKNTCCGGSCSAGWVLFGCGFIFPICWIVGLFLPCCTRDRNDKRAAIGCAIGLAIYIILIVALAASAPSWRYY